MVAATPTPKPWSLFSTVLVCHAPLSSKILNEKFQREQFYTFEIEIFGFLLPRPHVHAPHTAPHYPFGGCLGVRICRPSVPVFRQPSCRVKMTHNSYAGKGDLPRGACKVPPLSGKDWTNVEEKEENMLPFLRSGIRTNQYPTYEGGEILASHAASPQTTRAMAIVCDKGSVMEKTDSVWGSHLFSGHGRMGLEEISPRETLGNAGQREWSFFSVCTTSWFELWLIGFFRSAAWDMTVVCFSSFIGRGGGHLFLVL